MNKHIESLRKYIPTAAAALLFDPGTVTRIAPSLSVGDAGGSTRARSTSSGHAARSRATRLMLNVPRHCTAGCGESSKRPNQSKSDGADGVVAPVGDGRETSRNPGTLARVRYELSSA